ncbi:hypothetical protein CLAIMM_07281 [Cladophialophora immunda]|nr:hypothetical protein CLAIMM_07281 [Cladophialophora immunda]
MSSYDALPKGPCLRYVVLKPGASSDPLACQLLTSDIHQIPEFEAVSYPWGSLDKVSTIQVQRGQSQHSWALGITANLDRVLRRLRHSGHERVIWVDQLSIDQSNNDEKSHQVRLMGQIYRKAKRVLVWLGDSVEDGANAASLITELNDRIDAQLSVHGTWDELPNATPEDEISKDGRWRAIHAAFASPWFTRVWVIQEVGLAADPWVLFGDSEFDWTSMMRVAQWMLDFANFLLVDRASFPLSSIHAATLDGWDVTKSSRQRSRDFGTFSTGWTLQKLLHSAKGLKATDPRDFIYSLLGHPSALKPGTTDNTSFVDPDYNLPYLDAYHRFALEWLKDPHGVNLLLSVEHDENTLSGDYPSWVPRWNFVQPAQTLGLQTKLPFNAALGLGPSSCKPIDPRTLNVQGLVFDRVTAKSPVLDKTALRLPDPSPAQTNAPSPTHPVVAFWTASVAQGCFHESYAGDQRPLMAFVRMLTGERYTGPRAQFQADRLAYALRLLELGRHKAGIAALGEDTARLRDQSVTGNIDTFVDHAWYFCNGRVLVFTEQGRYGFAPRSALPGDLLAVVNGCKVPCVLRPVPGEKGHFRLVGESYVQGCMEGELVKARLLGGSSNPVEEETLVLV